MEAPLEIPYAIAHAYAVSQYGEALQRAFPWGALHRDALPRLQAWQERFHPQVKRRTPKKRKRKR